MAKVHDKFVIELAEVIKGYGNDPDIDDPFHLSAFYRFYELPEIAVSANHFRTMIPLELEIAKAIEHLPSAQREFAKDTNVPINDLISRQAAIDEIMGKPPEPHYPSWYAEQIKKLPYAQRKGKWIPVTERLPEENGDYLVTGRQGAVNKRRYDDGHWYGNWAVVAWMPLPEPWKGGAE